MVGKSMKKSSIDVLLTRSSRKPMVTVSPEDSVVSAAQAITSAGVGLALVMKNGEMVGVISERDLVAKWVCSKDFPKMLIVADIMTRSVEVVSPQETVFDCYLRFSARNCRHLPVIDSFGQVLGVLSMRDVTGYVVQQLSEGEGT
jgi:signal-transduction protein with cAMP-binding, CBS, and nucleotidyltransferase domain